MDKTAKLPLWVWLEMIKQDAEVRSRSYRGKLGIWLSGFKGFDLFDWLWTIGTTASILALVGTLGYFLWWLAVKP